MFKLAIVYVLLFLIGCSSSEKIDVNTADGAFALAQKYEKDERFEEAISFYADVKNKFPYSRFATEAELRIADVEFQRENFAEAEAAYRLFKEFHPEYEKIDYVTYRLGLSIFNQLPPTIDRDLTLAQSAIEQFSHVVSQYPNSKFVPLAKEHLSKTRQMLADKAKYIADFYYLRKKWESALGRYEDLLLGHSKMGHDAAALYGAALSAYNLKEMDKAKGYFKKLLEDHPKSNELALARKELADGF